MVRKVYNTDRAEVTGPYSHGVDAGDFVFLAGQTARNSIGEAGKVEDIAGQTEECFKNLFSVLEEAGLTSDHVIKVNVYLTDMKHFDEMNRVYEKQFSAPYPSRTCVAVYGLPLGADVEIEAVARKS